MKFLSIDPAGSSGFAVLDEKGKVLEHGFFKCSTKTLGERLLEQYTFFKELINKNDFSCVFIEDFKVGRQKSAAESSYAFRGVLKMLCAELNKECLVISISLWKKNIGINSRLTKAQKIKLGVNANKIQIKEALEKKGYSLPEKTENKRTGKIVNTPYDCWDAIGIGLQGVKEYLDE